MSIEAIVIPTRGRPEALRRCADGQARNLAAHGRAAALVVADDSDPDGAEADRRGLREVARRHGIEVWHIDVADKRRFADRLVRAAGVAPALVAYALFDGAGTGAAHGANRNALLLHTSGRMFLGVDDDTVCRLGRAPGWREGAAYSQLHKPVEMAYFGDAAAAEAAIDWQDADLLALHEAVLGQPAGAGVVRASWQGFAGDTGSDNLHDFFTFARAEAPAVLDHFGAGIGGRGRHAVRFVRRLTVGSGTFWPMPCTAADNRVPLPPFLPVGRSEDFAFACALQACFPGDSRAYLPWVIVHDPQPPRVYPPEDDLVAAAARPLMNNLVALCMEGAPPPPPAGDPAAALLGFGRYLRELGALPAAELAELLVPRLLGRRRALAQLVERVLAENPGAPAAWVRLGTAYLARLRDPAAQAELLRPADLPAASQAEAVDTLRAILTRQGALLEVWPRCAEVAAELRIRGEPLGQRVGP